MLYNTNNFDEALKELKENCKHCNSNDNTYCTSNNIEYIKEYKEISKELYDNFKSDIKSKIKKYKKTIIGVTSASIVIGTLSCCLISKLKKK